MKEVKMYRLRTGIRGCAAPIALVLAVVTATSAGATPGHSENRTSATMAFGANTSGHRTMTVTIVESQSENPSHTSDARWQAVASAAGYTATIVDQETLDDTANLETTDILIVSSGIIELTPTRVQTIKAFLEDYGPVYLQCEYANTLTSNLAFETIVGDLGGSFVFLETVNGNLAPVNVIGVLGTEPNVVTSISYYWYGCDGDGDATVEAFLEHAGDNLGWVFTPPRGSGVLVQTTDQDWVIQSQTFQDCEALMENILDYLALHAETPVNPSTWGAIKSLFR
jgi:hypothetical protein